MPYAYKLPPLDPCPVEHVVRLIGGKWKARLLGRIRDCPCSVGELQRFLPRARPQVLLQQLKLLEQNGLIDRAPPASGRSWGCYALTDRGAALLIAVDAIAIWGELDLAANARSAEARENGMEAVA